MEGGERGRSVSKAKPKTRIIIEWHRRDDPENAWHLFQTADTEEEAKGIVKELKGQGHQARVRKVKP